MSKKDTNEIIQGPVKEPISSQAEGPAKKPTSSSYFPFDDLNHLDPIVAAKINEKKIKAHEDLIKRMLEDENPTKEELVGQLLYKGNFGADAVLSTSFFKRNMFS